MIARESRAQKRIAACRERAEGLGSLLMERVTGAGRRLRARLRNPDSGSRDPGNPDSGIRDPQPRTEPAPQPEEGSSDSTQQVRANVDNGTCNENSTEACKLNMSLWMP